jgi:hypothetical protein
MRNEAKKKRRANVARRRKEARKRIGQRSSRFWKALESGGSVLADKAGRK